MGRKAQQQGTSPDGVEAILQHLDRYGVEDKDTRIASRRRSPSRPVKKKKKNRRTLDLHGKTAVVAEQVLRGELARCSADGVGELLIIHGKGRHSDPAGGPVLKTLVRDMLAHELHHLYRLSRMADPADGGSGATLVRFR